MFIIPEKLWGKIKTLIPDKKSKVGRPQKDPKVIINGIFYQNKFLEYCIGNEALNFAGQS